MEDENVQFDNEILAYLSVRKEELIVSHESYIEQHPEIREVMNDFLTSVLLHKPVSICFSKSVTERHFRLREGVLPPLQPGAPPIQAPRGGRSLRCRQAHAHPGPDREVRDALRAQKELHDSQASCR